MVRGIFKEDSGAGNGMTDEACGTCKFFKRRANLMSEGQCLRYPGTPLPMPMGAKLQLATLIPNKHQNEWCGEYKMKVTIQ